MDNICQNVEKMMQHVHDIINLLSNTSTVNPVQLKSELFDTSKITIKSSNNSTSNISNEENNIIMDQISQKVLATMDLLLKTSRNSKNLVLRDKKTVELIKELRMTIETQNKRLNSENERKMNRADQFTMTEDVFIHDRLQANEMSDTILELKEQLKEYNKSHNNLVSELKESKREIKKLKSIIHKSRLILDAQRNHIKVLEDSQKLLQLNILERNLAEEEDYSEKDNVFDSEKPPLDSNYQSSKDFLDKLNQWKVLNDDIQEYEMTVHNNLDISIDSYGLTNSEDLSFNQWNEFDLDSSTSPQNSLMYSESVHASNDFKHISLEGIEQENEPRANKYYNESTEVLQHPKFCDEDIDIEILPQKSLDRQSHEVLINSISYISAENSSSSFSKKLSPISWSDIEDNSRSHEDSFMLIQDYYRRGNSCEETS